MRIAFLLNVFPKTSETFILNQIIGLIERGHTVDIYARYPNSDDPLHPNVTKYKLVDRTLYLSSTRGRNKRLLAAAKIFLRRDWGRLSYLLRSTDTFRWGLAARELLLDALFLETPLNESTYDVIHCQFGTAGIFGQHLREIGLIKGPILTTFHGYDIGSFVAQNGVSLYGDLFRKGEAFTCSGKFIHAKLVESGCDPSKIILFKLGTDLTEFDFLERRIGSDGIIRLITVARLVEKKGHEYSIRAVAKLASRFPKLDYTIVGDGYLRRDLSSLIEQLNLQENVRLAGLVTEEEKLQLLTKSHIFVLASVSSSDGDVEGQGMVLQEAQAMGLPVICTNHNGFPDSIVDGQTGFLVPERDADSLSQKLAELIGQADQWSSIGKKGRAFVEAEFDLNKRNDALVELYRDLSRQKL